MTKEKMIQIPEKLFIEMCQYFILEQTDSSLQKNIFNGLSDKLDRIVQHDLYTKYKTSLSKEESEKARKEYLEKRGILESFQW